MSKCHIIHFLSKLEKHLLALQHLYYIARGNTTAYCQKMLRFYRAVVVDGRASRS